MSAFKPNKEGVFFDLPEAIYRQAPGVNISALKIMGRSPAHYHAGVVGPKFEPTPAMVFGTILHGSILEPGKTSYVVRPVGMDYRSKEGRAWRDAQSAPILTADEGDRILGAIDAVKTHPLVAGILAGKDVRREVAVFKRHEATGRLLKGRLDIVTEDSDGRTVVLDIKTTEDASANTFPKAMANFGYDQQAAYYSDLVGAEHFVFIAVEKTAPFAVGLYALDAESLDLGRAKNEAQLATLAECEDANSWPAYPETIETISLPNWAK